MKRFVAGVTTILLFAVPAAGQSVPEKTGMNATVGISPSTQDFVTEAANSDMLEIASSKLALTKGDAKTKTFAEKMIEDHTKTSSELKALAGGGTLKVDLPTAMDKTHQSKLDKLSALTGADFTKEYESMQVSAHKDAVSLFERYSKGGDNPNLKAFAAKHLPHLQDHLRMAEGLPK
jgi:putative membrane protein